MIWRAMFGSGGGNILAFWRPWPPSEATEWEQKNHCLLYGHLGGVMYLTTNTLGDTLVSVGQDRGAKLWRAKPQISHNSPAILQPVRKPFISHCSVLTGSKIYLFYGDFDIFISITVLSGQLNGSLTPDGSH